MVAARLLICFHQGLPLYTARNWVRFSPGFVLVLFTLSPGGQHEGVSSIISPGDLLDLALHGRLKAPTRVGRIAIRTCEDTFKMSYPVASLMYAVQQFEYCLFKSLTRTRSRRRLDGLTIAVPKGVLLVAVLRNASDFSTPFNRCKHSCQVV